jgi:hypothetical protein
MIPILKEVQEGLTQLSSSHPALTFPLRNQIGPPTPGNPQKTVTIPMELQKILTDKPNLVNIFLDRTSD